MEALLEHIFQSTAAAVDRLYGAGEGPSASCALWSCRAIFQALRPLSKTIIMRLVFFDTPIDLQVIIDWMLPNGINECDLALEELRRLRILLVNESEANVSMNRYFLKSFRSALHSNEEPLQVHGSRPSDEADAEIPTIEFLDDYCASTWEKVLYFLLSADMETDIHESVRNFMLQTQIMQRRPEDPSQVSITTKGYDYMLKDFHSQLWIFVMESLKRAAQHQEEIMSLVFILSYCELGKGYPVAALSKIQRMLLSEFCNLGIVYRSSSKATHFYPCRMAIDLLFKSESDETKASTNQSSHRNISIIVETNFQVVSYLTSDLHMFMISLFVDGTTMVRFQDMVIGSITRQSAKESFAMGIKASQIVDFLETHAHPLVRNRKKIVPENVSDQLVIWEREKSRLHVIPDAVVIDVSEIAGGERLHMLFSTLVEKATQLSVLLWSNKDKKMLAVTPEGYQQLQSYVEYM